MALYDSIGQGYANLRRADPRLAAAIHAALGDAASVVNVGAGAGSYEPSDRDVIAVEPSEVMIRQRTRGAARCVRGTADRLPLGSKSADASMAVLSAHHWPDLAQGLAEMARVARHRVVMLTWVPDLPAFWLTTDYFPEIVVHDRTIFPETNAMASMLERLAGPTTIKTIPIPHDCLDGMLCAYWRRPEAYLREDVRAAMSSFRRIDAGKGVQQLGSDLESGRWTQRHGELLALEELDLGYRLFISELPDPLARA